MSTPTVSPGHRDPDDVAPTDSYQPADRVWVYRGGTWRAGVIEAVSELAATVTYRPNSARGTGVDTLTAEYVQRRAETDPFLDRDGELSTRLQRR
jgi:hypothetical protein